MSASGADHIRRDNTCTVYRPSRLSGWWRRVAALLWITLLAGVWSAAFGSVKVFIKESARGKDSSDVYVKDYTTGKAWKFAAVSEAVRQHYHGAEYHDGYLYIIRRRPGGDDAYLKSPDWRDELWRYNKAGKGVKVFTSRGLDFRVSKDGKLTAVVVGSNARPRSALHLLKFDGKPMKVFQKDKLGLFGHFDFEEWTGRYLWLKDQWAADICGFIRIDTRSMAVRKYDVSLQDEDYDLDTASLRLAYSDYPAMFDIDTAEEFVKNKTSVKLYVYDLTTKKKRLIARSVAKPFAPKWKGVGKLEYNNPRGKGRLVKSIL